MKKLQTRFSLVLGSVLLVATLLPVLVLYLMSKSGLVEATYITNTRDIGDDDIFLRDLLLDELQPLPGLPQNPLTEEDRNDLLLWLMLDDPNIGQQRVPLVFDPETGQIIGVASDSLDRIMISSQIFKFRVDLPAWIVIGSFPLFGLLLGFIVSLVMSRSVTRPVSQLAEAAKAIGRRDLGYRVQTKGSQELVDLVQSFNRMADELEQAEATRRNLVADVAHELRTPLTVLQGNLRAILDGVRNMDDEEIALLYEQTEHLNRLVDDLRELSLAEAHQLSLDCQEVDLIRLAKETVAHFDPLAGEQGIQLTSELDEPLIHPCLDENRIRQVLHNLLSNAFHHTPGGGEVKITLKRLDEEGEIQIFVSDSGDGISPQDLPHIFDRFYRTDGIRGRDRGGSGLGLAIAKAILEAQGCSIDAQSPGKGLGSIFTIRLPVAFPPAGPVSGTTGIPPASIPR